MTHVLVVNAGSSSLKLTLLDGADEMVESVTLDRWTGGDETEDIKAFVDGLPQVDAVGHRVVHGGAEFTGPVRLDEAVRDRIAGWPSWRHCTSPAGRPVSTR